MTWLLSHVGGTPPISVWGCFLVGWMVSKAALPWNTAFHSSSGFHRAQHRHHAGLFWHAWCSANTDTARGKRPLFPQLMYFATASLIRAHCKNWQHQLSCWWKSELEDHWSVWAGTAFTRVRELLHPPHLSLAFPGCTFKASGWRKQFTGESLLYTVSTPPCWWLRWINPSDIFSLASEEIGTWTCTDVLLHYQTK